MSKIIRIGRIDVNLEGCKSLSRKDINSIFSKYSEDFRNDLEDAIAKEYPKKVKKKSKEGEE
jgi:ClpP class serine protease